MDAYCCCLSLLSLLKHSRRLASTSEEEATAAAAVGSQVTTGDWELDTRRRRRCAGETQPSSPGQEPAGSWVGLAVGSQWAAEVVLVGVVGDDDDAMLFDEW